MATHTIPVWLVMNEDGDYEVSGDLDQANELLTNNCGGEQRRLVKFNVTMAAPEAVEVNVTVPDEAGQTVEVAAS